MSCTLQRMTAMLLKAGDTHEIRKLSSLLINVLFTSPSVLSQSVVSLSAYGQHDAESYVRDEERLRPHQRALDAQEDTAT